jgi:hypothetical protein
MYVLPVFIGVTAWLYWASSLVSTFFLISCVECLVICIDSFEFCKSSRRVKTEKRHVRGIYFPIILVVLSKYKERFLFPYGKPHALCMFFEI